MHSDIITIIKHIIIELPSNKIIDENVYYTIQDLPRLNIMKKISSNLNISSIFLEPHFEDYEEVFTLTT